MTCVSGQDPSDGGKTGGNAQSRVQSQYDITTQHQSIITISRTFGRLGVFKQQICPVTVYYDTTQY